MTEYEATGKTLEEAVEKALAALGIKKDNANIEIQEEPTQGLLGIIGSKTAKVKVKPIKTPSEYLRSYVEELIDYMGINESRILVSEDEEKLLVEVYGEDVGSLIGRRGKTLSDIQYVLNVVIRRQFAGLHKMVVVDIEKYRERREKTLTQLARNVANKVSKEGYEQALEPMSPQERRIVHIALQDYEGIKTYSEGDEPYRKVIVAPK